MKKEFKPRVKATRINIAFVLLIMVFAITSNAQPVQDSTLNNLVHAPDYKTAEWGKLEETTKTGKGKQQLLLIAGDGFDVSIYDDFIRQFKKQYTIHAVTLPGYGKTHAPPMPPAGTSYGEQSWTMNAVTAIANHIQENKLNKPVVIGQNAFSTQVALRLALNHPDQVGGIIILGGRAKFIIPGPPNAPQYSVKSLAAYVDNNTAPKWFKTVTRTTWNQGTLKPQLFSVDSVMAHKYWAESYNYPLPVMIRYTCEFFASDYTLEFDKLTCPVMVLRAGFNDRILSDKSFNSVKPQYIDGWDKLAANKNASLHTIENAGMLVWKDQPEKVYNLVKEFLEKVK
jgi:pimeloyl-ACP methyl ester carboxylesterase